MVLTLNETTLISYLWRHSTEQLSINGLAKKIGITPKGTAKILKKLEVYGIVIKQTIANADIYHLNFHGSKTEDIVKYALKSESPPNLYVKVMQKDTERLQELTYASVLFGSTLTKGLHSQDIDILIVLNKKKLGVIQSTIKEIERIIPKRIHAVFQTKSDLLRNLQKQDPIITRAVQEGFILGGYDLLYKLIKTVQHPGNF